MNILAINKISRNLKMKGFKMPNAAYSNRQTAQKPVLNTFIFGQVSEKKSNTGTSGLKI